MTLLPEITGYWWKTDREIRRSTYFDAIAAREVNAASRAERAVPFGSIPERSTTS